MTVTSRELFEKAIAVVLAHEGGVLTDHPNDRGGLTKFGISHRWHPDIDVAALTRREAIEIYWHSYWVGRNYELLPDPVATKVFDLAVNLGHQPAVVCLQHALRACGLPVTIDGALGPQTSRAAFRASPAALMAALRSEAAGAYRVRVARDSRQAAFLNGWLNRAYS
jgi:lysozyme family protein